MDEENVIHTCDGILFRHKEKWSYDICRKMDEMRNHYVKQNKPGSEKLFFLLCVEPRFKILYVYVCISHKTRS